MRRAFTLMELLVVVTVLIILVVLTLPRVKYALDESKLRESSRQLNSYFAMAKARAASTGRPCGVWMVPQAIGDPTPPGAFAVSELYLAEVPAPYTGDTLDARVVARDGMGNGFATISNGPNWRLDFLNGPGSLLTLVNQGDTFQIRFDHKGPIFLAERFANNEFYVTSQYTGLSPNTPVVPPVASGNLGYFFEITRLPVRIGQPLSLPRGTCIDLSYSGLGNTGTDFYSSANSTLVLFAPSGNTQAISYQTWNASAGQYVLVVDGSFATAHFLIGRPEKIGNALPESNLSDLDALWVSVGRGTGSVVTTSNAVNVALPFGTPAQQQNYLFEARTFAREQNVKGGN